MRSYQKLAYTKIQNSVIYALVSPEDKTVYIGQSLEHQLRDSYKKHLSGKTPKTEVFTKKLKEKNKRPCLFELERISDTKVKGYYLQIVWARIFMDLDYQILNTEIAVYANNLTEENQRKYEERKAVFDESRLSCDKCKVQEFARKKCEMKEVKEYERI